LQGQVYKIHSDFYYVKCSNSGETLECKLRENLKKQKLQVCVGDFVEMNEGAIEKILPRRNFIKRPAVANLDLLVVVSSIKEPVLDFAQLDRYLAFAKYHKIPAALCFNKEDLEHENSLESDILAIYGKGRERNENEVFTHSGIQKSTAHNSPTPLYDSRASEPKGQSPYGSLGYDIIFTSALEKTGLEGLITLVKGKVAVLCGNSGVGKSSLLNAIGAANLRTKNVSQKTDRGVHTTRHVEILEFDGFRIMDTPGFSLLRFDFLMPQELTELFPDIAQFAEHCKFSDCNHVDTKDCAVTINLDKIPKSRYESFLELLGEAQEYKKKVTYSGIKAETSAKDRHKRVVPKISNKKRSLSRKVQKQNVTDDLF